jgi:hypothetical protein
VSAQQEIDAAMQKPCKCKASPWLVEIQFTYDGALYLQCPACNAKWHRWPIGTWQREKAAQSVDGAPC